MFIFISAPIKTLLLMQACSILSLRGVNIGNAFNYIINKYNFVFELCSWLTLNPIISVIRCHDCLHVFYSRAN